jgi:hypothetical protein
MRLHEAGNDYFDRIEVMKDLMKRIDKSEYFRKSLKNRIYREVTKLQNTVIAAE